MAAQKPKVPPEVNPPVASEPAPPHPTPNTSSRVPYVSPDDVMARLNERLDETERQIGRLADLVEQAVTEKREQRESVFKTDKGTPMPHPDFGKPAEPPIPSDTMVIDVIRHGDDDQVLGRQTVVVLDIVELEDDDGEPHECVQVMWPGTGPQMFDIENGTAEAPSLKQWQLEGQPRVR